MGSEISPELKKNLILSVGQHSAQRPFSPVEVATGLELLESHGMSNAEIAQLLLLSGTSMVSRFFKLLNISPNIRHVIDWGATGATLSFSSAVEIARLKEEEQNAVVTKALEYSLTKDEIIQIVQIRKRSGRDIGSCINEIIDMRPKYETKYVLVGAVYEKALHQILSEIKQYDRDIILKNVIDSRLEKSILWEGRLGITKFTLVGEEELQQAIINLKPDFETVINDWLLAEVINEK